MKQENKIYFKTPSGTIKQVMVLIDSVQPVSKNNIAKKLFSAAELWNIQRRMKSTIVR